MKKFFVTLSACLFAAVAVNAQELANWNWAGQQAKTEVTADGVITGTDVEKKKPDPAAFLLAAERLGVEPKDCVVIEDAFYLFFRNKT